MTSVAPEDANKIKEIIDKKIEETLPLVGESLTSNPKFEELLYKELLFFYRKTLKSNFDIEVSDDKNTVTITSYNSFVDCSKEDFNGKNKTFLRTIITIEGDYLVVDYNQGVLFDRSLLEKQGIYAEMPYESKMETYYSKKYVNKDGIELSENNYSDVYHFSDESNYVDVRERTMSSFHKPLFYLNCLASIPIHVMKAIVRNTYRKEDSLAVIHSNVATATMDGYEDIKSGLYLASADFPEMLRGKVLFAKTSDSSDRSFDIVDNYAENIEKAYEKAKEEFKKEFENSELKNTNPGIYEEIKMKL
jgi:hypothetical protein